MMVFENINEKLKLHPMITENPSVVQMKNNFRKPKKNMLHGIYFCQRSIFIYSTIVG